jgi:hypothetical protein
VVHAGLMSLHEAMHYMDSDYEDTLPPVQRHVPKNVTEPRKRKRKMPPYLKRIQAQEKSALEDLRHSLLSQANGVILWVVLLIDTLVNFTQSESMFTFAELREKAKQLPVDLDQVYQEVVLSLKAKLTPDGLAKARKTLMWISAASEVKSVTLEELWDALAVTFDGFTQMNTSTDDPVTNSRIPIRSWNEFRRILLNTCGPLVEIIRPTAEKQINVGEVGPTSVIQLMHQTVKEFLETPGSAGPLHFRRDEATHMVEHFSQLYVQTTLPVLPTGYTPFPALEWPETIWEWKVAKVALYIEDKKLLPFCVLLAKARAHVLDSMKPHFSIVDHAFALGRRDRLEERVASIRQYDDSIWSRRGTGYDIATTGVRSSIIGRFVHIAAYRGLSNAVRSLLAISSTVCSWWSTFEDTVLNGALFAVLDVGLGEFRSTLIQPRRDNAVLAIDNLYKLDMWKTLSPGIDPDEFPDVSMDDIRETVRLLVNCVPTETLDVRGSGPNRPYNPGLGG